MALLQPPKTTSWDRKDLRFLLEIHLLVCRGDPTWPIHRELHVPLSITQTPHPPR